MKARHDLEAERKVNAEMRKTVGAEKQANVGAAMTELLTDLLQKQAEALATKAKAQEKERELHYREQKIAQCEAYLSEGQKQLKHRLEQQGIRRMSTVDETNLRRDVELQVRHQFSDVEEKIAIQVERLRHQEAAQKIREQQYKITIRDALEAEVRGQLAQADDQIKAADSKVEKIAYVRGLAEAQKMEFASTSETLSKREFLKGYTACYRSQVALHNMRNGLIAADSPGLEFLFDPTHAENPHNIGIQIGRLEVNSKKVAKNSTAEDAMSRKLTKEGAAREAPNAGTTQAGFNAVTVQSRAQPEFNNAGQLRATQTADRAEKVHQKQQIHPQQPSQEVQEEPARR